MDKPKPWLALSSWVSAFIIAVWAAGSVDHIARWTAIETAFAYSLLGGAFGLSAYSIARLLQGRVPTEEAAAERISLRRFRWVVIGVYFVMVLLVAFVLWTITTPGSPHDERDYAVFMAYITFILVQSGLGWPWARLGRHAMAERPDVLV